MAQEEGWFTDQYDRHEQRWFSRGNPTKLVQDNGVTSYDAPPDGPPNHLPQEIDTPPHDGPADLQRADDSNRASDMNRGDVYMRQLDAVASVGAPNEWLTKYDRKKWWRAWLPWGAKTP